MRFEAVRSSFEIQWEMFLHHVATAQQKKCAFWIEKLQDKMELKSRIPKLFEPKPKNFKFSLQIEEILRKFLIYGALCLSTGAYSTKQSFGRFVQTLSF